MAGTKSRTPTQDVVARWLKAGYGQGTGSEYKPFMYVRDVPSKGTSSMVKSRITGRTHHYLSRQEFKVHLQAEYALGTKDIREQYALLPLDDTAKIAFDLGVRHPVYPSTKTPTVMTTDLLLTLNRTHGEELLAISVKMKKELTPRVLEKLLIEKIYWNNRGVKWVLSTEESISAFRVKNLSFFESSLSDDRAVSSSIEPTYFSRCFESNHSPSLTFNEIMTKSTIEMGIDRPTGHALLGLAVWNHNSRINIDDIALTHRGRVLLLDHNSYV
ncbi:TnsA endonuclease N-terminal domain-containing protein [Pseudomonas arsenicoxydans]|uniref:Transposase n=1 Tax=Pseudomonas arsenicoxydans TaxID=702115 RepID=A0A4P6GF03_9PSED|nr:TnsA endonuclease N-terminal domain-containing protein [Pseudomonas arsenicoxydans]QAY84031.1 transposase [Pseudomonas arsenicoxydans]